MRIALATCAALPRGDTDDAPLPAAFAARGITAQFVVWNSPAVRWSGYDAVVLRSCWDYHHHAPAFLRWLDTLESTPVVVANVPAVLRWNFDKRYLADLAARGVPVIETVWLEQGSETSVRQLMERRAWTDAVVKPAISMTAHNTWRVSRTPDAEARLAQMVASGDVMVQPYAREIADDGEWSVFFFGGDYSHTVHKRPACGDFRVQNEFGGSRRRVGDDPELIAGARAMVEAVGAPCTYARVDGIVAASGLRLMELELIDPSLYFDGDDAVVSRFVDAVAAAL